MCYVHNQWYDISCATLFVTLPVVEHRFSSPPSLGLVTIVTELSWLLLHFQYFDKHFVHSLISSKRCKNCPLLGYSAVSGGNSLPTFRDKLSVPSSGFKNPKVCKNYLHSLCNNRRAPFSATSRRKPAVTHLRSVFNSPDT